MSALLKTQAPLRGTAAGFQTTATKRGSQEREASSLCWEASSLQLVKNMQCVKCNKVRR